MGKSVHSQYILEMKHSASSILIILVIVNLTKSAPFNHHQKSREMASLIREHPGTSLPILREIRQNISKTRAGIKLIISMEKELRDAAKVFSQNYQQSQNQKPSRKGRKLKDDKKPPPFSSWAG